MHCGSIENPETRAGQVYRVLRERLNEWVAADVLQRAAGNTPCLSTWISGVRLQLPGGGREPGNWALEYKGWRQRNVVVGVWVTECFYRLVSPREPTPEQTEFWSG